MAKLAAKQRRRRRIKRERAALYNPAATLSGSTLRRAANQLTGLQYDPQKQALKREMQQATRQGSALAGRASDYYTQLAHEEAGNVARSQAIGSELQSRLGKIRSGSEQAMGQIQSDEEQLAARDTALRGAGLSGGGQTQVAAEIAAQRQLAGSQLDTAQSQGELQTANWANLANVAAAARGLQGGESLGRIQNALGAQQADIRGKQTDLAGQIAQARTKNLLDLRQQSYENIVTAEGLGIDRAKIAADVAQSRAENRLATQRIKSAERQNNARIRAQMRGQTLNATTQRRGQDMTAAQRAADRASREKIQAANRRSREAISHARGSGGRLENSDARKVKNQIAMAVEDIRGGVKEKALRKSGASGLIIRAGKELNRGDRPWLSPSMVSTLRGLGVHIPQKWLPPTMRKGAKLGTPGIPHNKR